MQAYKSGTGVLELAAVYGLHRNSVRDILRRRGVPPRQRGLSRRQIREACELYAEGQTIAVLGGRFNVHPTTVWRALKAIGLGRAG